MPNTDTPEPSCIAGDYDSDRDGVKEFSITCFANGNRKSYISYLIDGATKNYEYTYYESNGNLKAWIYYYIFSFGHPKLSEATYYESNGNQKTWIQYRGEDTKKAATTDCYSEADGFRQRKPAL